MGTGECDHCGASFADEEDYLRHLRDEHPDELGPIEQRRVAELDPDDDGAPTAAVYGAVLGGLLLAGLLAYVLFSSGGGGASDPNTASLTQPRNVGAVHYHGTIDATIGGQELDFGRQRFQLQADAFHFENGEGERWHVHAERVTLAYAMQTLGIDVTNGTVAYDGTTYGDDPGETAIVEVNGESVTPGEYVLQKGDSVQIVANESN
ncbi:C2H2-type zinc finger protein [Halorussus lipolyticus]|uniref:C2H2-type zinc finger protein n=1 Tax=Halorussus lipolyticus TaxID=3034024 RepID=UPI0023E7AB65|nr:C2H2-type zinc finger protein [Halorussus sp. DT80]